jgi:phage/conjugal plasmid C-4 type zinc finger TraR family protein
MTADKPRTRDRARREGDATTSPTAFRARRLLTRELAEVVARLEGLPPLEPEARRGDEADRIQARDEHDLGVTERARFQARRGLLLAALHRLEDGSYGLCLDCGAPIAAARLKALPAVERCVPCQTQLEQAAPPAVQPRLRSRAAVPDEDA